VLHGAKASRLLKHIEAGHPVCVEVMLVDGLVLGGRSSISSVNYRSVVLFGTGRAVQDETEKNGGAGGDCRALVPAAGKKRASRIQGDGCHQRRFDQDRPGLSQNSHRPTMDDEADYALPIWAGVLPLQETPLAPVRDELMTQDLPAPMYVAKYSRSKRPAR